VHVPLRYDVHGVHDVGATPAGPREAAVPIRTTDAGATPLRIVGSRSHRDCSLDRYLPQLEPYQLVAVGSSIKFCLVAEGSADFYPRFGPTSEWDTAAAQAVVEAAGGRVIQTDGQRLRYNAKAEC
jgi:3'(2'), 5'-bisphosphate nucleotidase